MAQEIRAELLAPEKVTWRIRVLKALIDDDGPDP